MKKFKRLWRRRPRLSRGGKIIRNCALLIALALTFWFLQGCPPVTSEMALRALEQKMFLNPGETLYKSDTDADNGYRQIFVRGDGYAYTGEIKRHSLLDIGLRIHNEAAEKDGPTLLRIRTQPLKPDASGFQTVLFCPWGPENAVRAEATLTAQYVKRTYPMIYISQEQPAARGELISAERKNWKKTISASKNEQGFFAIPVSAQTDEEAQILSVIFTAKLHVGNDTHIVDHVAEEARYRLDFYDENDVLLQSVTGKIDRFY